MEWKVAPKKHNFQSSSILVLHASRTQRSAYSKLCRAEGKLSETEMMWGRSLHNALYYFTRVLYMRDILQAIAHHILIVSNPCFLTCLSRVKWTPFGVAAKHKLREGLKIDFFFFLSLREGGKNCSDEQEKTKPGCTVAMVTAARQSVLFCSMCHHLCQTRPHNHAFLL